MAYRSKEYKPIAMDQELRYQTVIIGFDPSYDDTGFSVWADGELIDAGNVDWQEADTKPQKRLRLRDFVSDIVYEYVQQAFVVEVYSEGVRQFSSAPAGSKKDSVFVSFKAITTLSMLSTSIIDPAGIYDVPVYGVETKSWKSHVVGSSVPEENIYKFDPKKYKTLKWCVESGYEYWIKKQVSKQKKNGVIEVDDEGNKYTWNDNIADAIAIGRFGVGRDARWKSTHLMQ